jgi:molybdopterin converting factor small subunit
MPAAPGRAAAPRTVRVALFATAREAVGRASIERTVPREGMTIRSFLASLAQEHSALAAILPSCRVARNGKYVSARTGRVRPGDELALHPPYSGG